MRIKFWQKDTGPAFFEENTSDVSLPADEPTAELVSVEMSDTAKTYNKAAGWIILVGVALLPLFFLPISSNALDLNKQILLVAIAGVSLIVWLLGVVISGQMSLRINPLDKGIGALLLATVAASVFSLMKTNSIFGLSVGLSESLVSVFTLSVLYFVAVNVFEDSGRKLTIALCVSSVLALLYGLAQMFTLYIFDFSVAHSRAFNTVGSVNTLGLLGAILLPIFHKTKVLVRGNKYLDVAKLGMILSLAVLVILNWWVLWTVAIAGMLAVTAFDSIAAAQGSDRKWKVSRFILPMTVIVLGVFLLIVNFNFPAVRGNLPVEVAPSYGLSWDVAVSVLKERLVFGYGPENYSMAFDKYGAGSIANSTLSNLKFFDSTAQVFNWMVSGGVLMILAGLFFVWSLVETYLKARKLDLERVSSSEFTAAASGAVALVVALFVYPFNLTLSVVMYAYMALLVLVVWGGRLKVMNIEDKPIVSLSASIGFIVGLILVLAGTYFTALRYSSDVVYAKALTRGGNANMVQGLVDAVNWNNQDDRYYRSLSQATLNILSEEINKKADPKDTGRAQRIQNNVQSAINFARRATEISPMESSNWFNLGVVYQAMVGLVDGVESLAEDAYNKASELRPGDASFANRAGSMYLARADLLRQLGPSAGGNSSRFYQEANASLLKAETYFKKAIDMAGNYGLAIYNLGAVYDRQGKVNESIQQLEKIIQPNASEPGLWFELGLLYYRANRKTDAAGALQNAILLAPQYANARWYLALLMEETKNYDGAIKQLEAILETNSDNQLIMDKIAQLKAGKIEIPPGKVTDKQPLDEGQSN